MHYKLGWCIQLRHSQLCFNGGAGLWMNTADGFIMDNWFSANGRYGVCCDEGENNSAHNFTGNRIEWNRCGGVRVDVGGFWNMTGNNFDRNSGPALDLGGKYAGHFTVCGNFFNRNGRPDDMNFESNYCNTHILCRNCSNLTITANGFMQGVDDGNIGTLSPEYIAVFLDCTQTIFCHNSMDVDRIVCNSMDTNIISDNVVGVRHYRKPDWAPEP